MTHVHPRASARTPTRHAQDTVVHLNNAIRAARRVVDTSAAATARTAAGELADRLELARGAAIDLRIATQREEKST